MQIDRITIVCCRDQDQKKEINKWLKDLQVGSPEGICFSVPDSCQNDTESAAKMLINLSMTVKTAKPNGVDLKKLRVIYVLDEYTVDSFESIKDALFTGASRMFDLVMLDIVFKTDRVPQGYTMKDIWQKISGGLSKDKPVNVLVKISLFSQFANDGAIFRNADSDVAGQYIVMQSCGKLEEFGTDMKAYAYSNRQLVIRDDDIKSIISSLVMKKAETLFNETESIDYDKYIAEVVCRNWVVNEGGKYKINRNFIRDNVERSMPAQQYFCTFVPENESDVRTAMDWFMKQRDNISILKEKIPRSVLNKFKAAITENLEAHPSYYNLDTVRFLRSLSETENRWEKDPETLGNFPEFKSVGLFGSKAKSYMSTMYESAHLCVTACENITLNTLGKEISKAISDLANEVENHVNEKIDEIVKKKNRFRNISDQEITRFELQNKDFIKSIRDAVDDVVKRQSFDDPSARKVEDVIDKWNEGVQRHCTLNNTIAMLNGMGVNDIISRKALLEENPVFLTEGYNISQKEVGNYAVISSDARNVQAITEGAGIDYGKYERLPHYNNISCIYEYQLTTTEHDKDDLVQDVEDACKVVPALGMYEVFPIIPEVQDNSNSYVRRESEWTSVQTVVSATEEPAPVVIDRDKNWDISVPRWTELESNPTVFAKFEEMTDKGEWKPTGPVDSVNQVGPLYGRNIVLNKSGKYGSIRITLTWLDDNETVVAQGLKNKCTCALHEKRGKIEVGDGYELAPNTLGWIGEKPPLVCVKYSGSDYRYYLKPDAEKLYVANDSDVKIVAVRSDKFDVTME